MRAFLSDHRGPIVTGTASFLITGFVQLYPLVARFAV